ncbi:thioesterase II family protein [Streptomyces sp. NPDC057743]|uniref:thioesterase II family protein n=1 Tax=Streptomyces sp. NPDC057743 TaxID=3346236 RepID=UPI0036894854
MTTTPDVTRTHAWFERFRPLPRARLRLFCLPHAGGGAYAYRSWARRLAPHIEVVAIRPPGRERRYGEEPFTSLDRLVPALVRALGPWLDRPHAYFGHSMGALTAFEVCRTARHIGLPQPERLLVSGTPAPQLPRNRPRLHDAPTDAFVQRLRDLGGTPPEVLADADALSAILPTLRADWSVAETYAYRPGPPLTCPLSVFGGTTDPQATAEELRAWRAQTEGDCTLREFPGGHFFLNTHHTEVLSAVSHDLAPAPTEER